MIENDRHRIEIQENYRDFIPPQWVYKSVSRLVDGIPQNYLVGLKTILLTNASQLNHSQRRKKTISRKHKVLIRDSRGLYHQKWKGQPATIDLFVDNIIHNFPTLVLIIPFFQDLLMADVLYHEIGHHIHKTKAPEHRERENVADDWRIKLTVHYFNKRYWYLRPLRFIIEPLGIFTRKLVSFFTKVLRMIQRRVNANQ